MDIAVHKYGGSSVATVDRLHRVARRVAQAHRGGTALVVVVSAQGDTTDDLLALAERVAPERPGRELDQLLATGECASAALLAIALNHLDVPAVSLTGPQAGIEASGKHGSGVIVGVRTERILRSLRAGQVVVVAGFQGANTAGDIITLGRGGSDTTAVALAAELGAARCEIFTDVDGVYTADPRVVRAARLQPVVDAGLMAEMAFAGARVLHSRAVELAAMENVDLRVANTFSDEPGTIIRPGGGVGLESRRVVVGVTHDLDVARVLIHCRGGQEDLAAGLLNLLARHSAPVDLVARSGRYEDEFRMGFTIRNSDVAEVLPALEEFVGPLAGQVRVDENVGKLSLVGMGLLNRPEYTARMMAALSSGGVPTSWISTSQLRTSVTTPREQTTAAVELLHREFEPEWGGLRPAPAMRA